jgi:hypothetical protein
VNSTRDSMNLHNLIDKRKNAMPASRFQLGSHVEKKLAISNLDDNAYALNNGANQKSLVHELTMKFKSVSKMRN